MAYCIIVTPNQWIDDDHQHHIDEVMKPCYCSALQLLGEIRATSVSTPQPLTLQCDHSAQTNNQQNYFHIVDNALHCFWVWDEGYPDGVELRCVMCFPKTAVCLWVGRVAFCLRWGLCFKRQFSTVKGEGEISQKAVSLGKTKNAIFGVGHVPIFAASSSKQNIIFIWQYQNIVIYSWEWIKTKGMNNKDILSTQN